MQIASPAADRQVTEIPDFELATATVVDFDEIRERIYRDKIVVLKNQDLAVPEFVELGHRLGEPVPYYEPIYHHPDSPLVFVSSNIDHEGERIGVPKTGAFWHADYQFMPKPFAFTVFYPQKLPSRGRGTYFIDMAEAYRNLSPDLREQIDGAYGYHSVRRYMKIRPGDVYRPLHEVIAEVEQRTPPQVFPAVGNHPVTGERQLYLSEAFTYRLTDANGRSLGDELLRAVLAESGQLDNSYKHRNIFTRTYDPGDIVLWDNRALIHRALHNPSGEPTESYRVTVLDGRPLFEENR
ncbi:putative dioxygenase [Gordonia spumicola]|uniref:Putative dioxygenase n=1 Tax=Gordonia spumicola TaxID=589161 RepID=A0A7I9V6B3_9ACTN|nr:TauD/TfdA family dioxygenase [Gordonia spumicola]GEE00601.1 putative dioxygenase [Gordonia spumicola]